MKICVFTAHPGDSVMAAGGTLARYAAQGHQVVDVCATLGQALRPDLPEQQVAAMRESSRREAAAILGWSDVRNLGYRDTELAYGRELAGKITEILRAERPEIVLSYWWQNVHPDIRNLSRAVSDATIFAAFHYPSPLPPHTVRKVYQFPYLNAVGCEPEIFIDITDFAGRKREAIGRFRAEDELFRSWEGPASTGLADQVLGVNRGYGQLSGVAYAEAFREFFAVETKSRAILFLPI